MGTTGTLDTDRYLLFLIEDHKTLTALLCTDKYWYALSTEHFWHQKFIRTFGCTMKKERNINYQQLYRKLIHKSLAQVLLCASGNGYLELFMSEQAKLFLSSKGNVLVKTTYGGKRLVNRQIAILDMAQYAMFVKHPEITNFLLENNYLNDDSKHQLQQFISKHVKDK